MGLDKFFLAFLAIVGVLCLVQLAAAQNGCTNPPCPNNTVPCAHCTGTGKAAEAACQIHFSAAPGLKAGAREKGTATERALELTGQ